jgi:hypothetical protein
MAFSPRVLVYIAAAAALVIGIAAYALSDEGDEHEEEGLLEGDAVKVAAVGIVLAIVGVLSFAYLAKTPPGER